LALTFIINNTTGHFFNGPIIGRFGKRRIPSFELTNEQHERYIIKIYIQCIEKWSIII